MQNRGVTAGRPHPPLPLPVVPDLSHAGFFLHGLRAARLALPT